MQRVGRLYVSCQHEERQRARSALYLAGDNDMSRRAIWGRKAVPSGNAVSGCRRNPEPPFPVRVFWRVVFQACVGTGSDLGDTGLPAGDQSLGAPRLGWWLTHKPSLTEGHLQQAGSAGGNTCGHISARIPRLEWESVRVWG